MLPSIAHLGQDRIRKTLALEVRHGSQVNVRAHCCCRQGRRLTQDEAKVAFVTGWMISNGHASDVVAFSGHAVQLRRSTTTFDKGEFASLIEYIMAECALRGITIRDPADYLR